MVLRETCVPVSRCSKRVVAWPGSPRVQSAIRDRDQMSDNAEALASDKVSHLAADVAAARAFMSLSRGWWSGASSKRAWFWTLALGSMILINVGVNVGVNAWHGWFFNALEKKDGNTASMAILASDPRGIHIEPVIALSLLIDHINTYVSSLRFVHDGVKRISQVRTAPHLPFPKSLLQIYDRVHVV